MNVLPEPLVDHRDALLLAALIASVLVLALAAKKVRQVARSDRPDQPLSRIAMLIGLGWSSEAVWELTGRIPDFPAGPRILLFAVLEILLLVSMIRADRHVREHGWPGRAGTTAWIIAVSMGLVAAAVSHSFAEGLLRLAIPLLLTKQWWDGLVGDHQQRPEWVTSWRWTPRRLLLWLGAIEPGERDVETVHRERLTQTMTNLEFRRRHGSQRQQERAARRLARLSLTADDGIIADVRARVDRSTWFEVKHEDAAASPEPAASGPVPGVSARRRKAFHQRTLRTVRVKHPQQAFPAAQPVDQDPRSKQEIEDLVRFIAASPAPEKPLAQRTIAHLARTSPATVNRVLRRKQNPAPPPHVNGNRPTLEGTTAS